MVRALDRQKGGNLGIFQGGKQDIRLGPVEIVGDPLRVDKMPAAQRQSHPDTELRGKLEGAPAERGGLARQNEDPGLRGHFILVRDLVVEMKNVDGVTPLQ